MELSLGIRLVIIIPSLLFLIGISLKAVIEREGILRLMESYKNISKENVNKLWADFGITIVIDSLLLTSANGLIIIYELGHDVLGVIVLLVGIFLSLILVVGFLYSHKNGFIIGTFGMFGLLGGELAYFCLFDNILANSFVKGILIIIISAFTCAHVGSRIIIMSYPFEKV